MKQSQLFSKTLKETPKDEASINAQLLIRAGFIHKEMAGVYSFLELGLRVLRKIENTVREEMEKIGGREILMSILQPKELWEKTGRWERGLGEVMYKTSEGEGRELALGPTHEEMLTGIVNQYVKSYRDLPLYIYQISTKFRKELRPRSGLIRGREFIMKDLYSFHGSQGDFKKYYEIVKKSYIKILKRCGLSAIITEASGAGFTKDFTHEFQVLAENGEDTVIYCPKEHFSQNKEIARLKVGDKCPICRGSLKQGRSIEAGNIFPLGTIYSGALNAYFVDKDGDRELMTMGCYGLGISRIVGTVVEVHHDEKGIIWPEEIAPFDCHLIPIENTAKVRKAAEKIYKDLQKRGIEVLYDDRKDGSAGEKFADADLIGIPLRIVISERTLKSNCAEIKKRSEERLKLVKLNLLNSYIRKNSLCVNSGQFVGLC